MTLDSIVVGGGLAGLVAARDLSAAGLSCVLLESSNRLGGRTYYRAFQGAPECMIEVGGTFVDRHFHPLVYAEADRYGLDTVPPAGSDDNPTHVLGGRRLSGRIPVPADEAFGAEKALFELLTASRRIRPGVGLDQQDLADLDVPLLEYVDRLALPPVTRELVLSWGWNMMGQPVDQSSALWLLQFIAAHGSVLGVALSVDEVFAAGTASLVDALAADIPDVRLEHVVRAVRQDEDGVVVTADGTTALSARTVVLAVPVNKWRDIEFAPGLPAPQAEVADAGFGGRGLKVFIHAEGVPEGCHGSAFGGGIATLYDFGPLRDGRLLVAFTDPDHLDVSDPAAVERALQQFAPDARVIAVDCHDWAADQHTAGSWTSPRVGQISRVHSALGAPHGRMFVAGADVSTTWPAYIEGALETGARAAREVLAALA